MNHDTLLRELKKYVEHDPRCTTRTKGSDYGCSCGLQELLTRPEAQGATPCNLPFERLPQHATDPGFGPVPPESNVVNLRDEPERELSAKRERVFPIMGAPDIPWSLIAPWEETAKRNHGGQSLERLAQRGGLAPHEAVAVLTGQPCEPMDTEKAMQRLLAIVQERTAKREGFVTVPVDKSTALQYAALEMLGHAHGGKSVPIGVWTQLSAALQDFKIATKEGQ